MRALSTLAIAGLVLGGAASVFAQNSTGRNTTEQSGQTTMQQSRQTGAMSETPDVTYGNLKEYTPGKKIVVNVNNAPDKSFDLTSRNDIVSVANGLKSGDPVRVTEQDRNGKKYVEISRDTNPGAHGNSASNEWGNQTSAMSGRQTENRGNMGGAATPSGDWGNQTSSANRAATNNDTDVIYGKLKEFTAGKKVVVNVNNAPDKSYDLTDRDNIVTVASGLKPGDAVKLTERDQGGMKHVEISRDTNPAMHENGSGADRQR